MDYFVFIHRNSLISGIINFIWGPNKTQPNCDFVFAMPLQMDCKMD